MLRISYINLNKKRILNSLKLRKFKNLKIINSTICLYKKNLKINNLVIKYSTTLNKYSKNFLLFSNKKEIHKKILKLKNKRNILNKKNKIIKKKINDNLLLIPNILNKIYFRRKNIKHIIYEYKGKKNFFTQKILNHIELSKYNDLFEILKTGDISGSGFIIYYGLGLKLHNALVKYFLYYNNINGYKEFKVPHLVKRKSLIGTGQYPDKKTQLYKIEGDDLFLIPTGEVPLINIYSNKTFDYKDLPIKAQSHTKCFRKEAGSYGKNVRGLNRVHEFDKVEIIEIVDEKRSNKEFFFMMNHIKNLLKSLGLIFRIILVPADDISNTASITYDFEVFSIGQKIWLEVSSLSNCLEYQANNLNIYCKINNKKKNCHTLNGSSLSLPRILAALIEYYQYKKKIKIPKVLKPYC